MNRLAEATSPYLLQHAENPVDWYPWGDEAFERARTEDKPLLVSVGYSSCHWCHVMAHESFENAATAVVMNDLFVNVKVDREERPDIDAVTMEATVGMTGAGGWPTTVFMTPDGRPFYAGTYFPPEPRHGMPSFGDVLRAVSQTWRERRGDVERQAGRIDDALRSVAQAPPSSEPLTTSLLADAARGIARTFEPAFGGFGRAPKFPAASTSSSCFGEATRTRSRWSPPRSTRWPRAACTTSSAGAFTAIRSTTAGSSRTSRRCSTTTPCWRPRTSTPGS